MLGHDRFSVHPLFCFIGIVSAFFGQLFLFLAATFAALEHECAHSFVARRYGFALDKIVLMPYGAIVKGELDGISIKQELCVLIAGPLCNALTAFAFVALWWLFPETYPYTDLAFYASLSLAIVNLLPAKPLDGGKILYLFLKQWNKRVAKYVCFACSVIIITILTGYFIYSCFFFPDFYVLVFAILLTVSLFDGGQYERISFFKNLERGIEERRIAISADKRVGEAVRFLRDDKYLVFVLFSKHVFVGELPEEEFIAVLQQGEYSLTLREAMLRENKWECDYLP